MSQGGSIINFGELSKPATVLIKKISGAAGVLYEPTKMRRLAKANADAAIIEARSDIQVKEIHQRAMVRFIEEEGKNQENIEKITADALPLLNDGSSPDEMDNDWVRNFFDKCRLVSDEEMQTVWSKILAGEANEPGSFTRRSINFVSNMSKQEAHDFHIVCRFICGKYPLILNLEDEIYTKIGVHFEMLSNLESVGLIRFNSTTTFARPDLDGDYTLGYNKKLIKVHIPQAKKGTFGIGKVVFTHVGLELAKVVDAKPIPGFADYIQKYYTDKGFVKP